MLDKIKLEKAITYAANVTSLDARCDTPDWKIAENLLPHVLDHLNGDTDVQIYEEMTQEERRSISADPEKNAELVAVVKKRIEEKNLAS